MFALLILFLSVNFPTMWLGEILQLLCILPFGILCLFAISIMFERIMLAVCMLLGILV